VSAFLPDSQHGYKFIAMPVDDFTFKKSNSIYHPDRIYNVIPGDFTHDGKLDLLVMSQSSRRNELALSLYMASTGGGYGAPGHYYTK
jgi:hypothetical protein